jgi:hypothetical protein
MAPRPTTHDPAAAPAPHPAATRSRRRARARHALAAVAAVALLGACASTPAGTADDPATTEPASPVPTPAPTLELAAGSSVVGLPEDMAAPPVDAAAGAARTADDALLYVVTFGSSTCPAVADPTATAAGDGAVAVTFPEPGDGACTMDYVPATSVVALPDGVVPDADLAVSIGDWGEVTLPAGSDEPVWVQAAG